MSQLKQQLLLLGIANLSVDTSTQQQLEQFIATSSAHFDRVRLQRPDSSLLDLLLGFMTLHHQQAHQQWLHQRTTAIKMQAVFDNTLGDHANSFTNQDQHYLIALTHLWLMVQGACNIDYSYSNEQAETLSRIIINDEHDQLSSQFSTDVESLRCQFMQSYYLGKNHNKPNFRTRIKQLFRKV
ncbi:hypothetical protein [Photobacterium andalusiense]|uniref:Uncharacterized protein n=1 Tax=Photobacterium andalusiense TaxID=2204296 RepID=A0A1Y6MEW0_9GAMM|nr:hypothetical protein [Photobacterium andalusiense]SMY35076.1 hypothetical protein PAND9192_01744 [Photobacterium andalusiense]